jgi:hypothetical protein
MPRSVDFAPEIDAGLEEELASVAKENGQSQRFVLERAPEHSLHQVSHAAVGKAWGHGGSSPLQRKGSRELYKKPAR